MTDPQRYTDRPQPRELAEPEGLPPVRTDLDGPAEAATLSAAACYGTSVAGIEAGCGSGTVHGPH